MPDRRLKPDELFKFVREHETGNLFIALKQLDEEGTEPSLHDLCLGELRATNEAYCNIIISQGRQINVLREKLAGRDEVLKKLADKITTLEEKGKQTCPNNRQY